MHFICEAAAGETSMRVQNIKMGTNSIHFTDYFNSVREGGIEQNKRITEWGSSGLTQDSTSTCPS